MSDGLLPPLPASDPESVSDNKYSPFYKRSSGEFWREAYVEQIKQEPGQNCQHEFNKTEDGVLCEKCHFELKGNGLMVKDKKLFINNEEVKF